MFRSALRIGASSMLIRVPHMKQSKLPSSRNQRTVLILPAFRAGRVDLDVIE
jgi:hypothetical protein